MACKEGFNEGTELSYLDRLSHSVWYQHFCKASNAAFQGSSKLSYTKESLLIMELLSIVTQELLVTVALSSSMLNWSWTLSMVFLTFHCMCLRKGFLDPFTQQLTHVDYFASQIRVGNDQTMIKIWQESARSNFLKEIFLFSYMQSLIILKSLFVFS